MSAYQSTPGTFSVVPRSAPTSTAVLSGPQGTAIYTRPPTTQFVSTPPAYGSTYVSSPQVTSYSTGYPSSTVGEIQRETSVPAEDETDSAYSLSLTNGLLLAFLIGLLVVGLFFALFYLTRTETNFKKLVSQDTSGQPCSGQTCGARFYCDGNGVCRSGSGEGLGESCGKDADCTFGLKCLTDTKVCGTDPGTTPVSNFTDNSLVTTSTGTKQYLWIDPTGSYLSPMMPPYTFDYKNSRGLGFRSTNPTYQGKFVSNDKNGELIITDTADSNIKLIQVSTGDIQMVNTTCQINTGGQPLFFNNNPNNTTVSASATRVSTNGTVSRVSGTVTGTNGTVSRTTTRNNGTTFTTSRVTGQPVRANGCTTTGMGTQMGTQMGMQMGNQTLTEMVDTTTMMGPNGTVMVDTATVTDMVSRPFVTYFPVPSNNTSANCPSTWDPINGASVIAFSLEPGSVNST